MASGSAAASMPAVLRSCQAQIDVHAVQTDLDHGQYQHADKQVDRQQQRLVVQKLRQHQEVAEEHGDMDIATCTQLEQLESEHDHQQRGTGEPPVVQTGRENHQCQGADHQEQQ